MKTLYEMLGVRQQATLAEIEQGFRQSLDAHRARSGMRPARDQLQLQTIAAAYRVLSSPARRKDYDQRLLIGQQSVRRKMAFSNWSWLPWALLICLALAIAAGTGYRYSKAQEQRNVETGSIKKFQAENNTPRTPG